MSRTFKIILATISVIVIIPVSVMSALTYFGNGGILRGILAFIGPYILVLYLMYLIKYLRNKEDLLLWWLIIIPFFVIIISFFIDSLNLVSRSFLL